jgi:hypothetical protein
MALCAGCGAGSISAPEIGVERQQVFDLPASAIGAGDQASTRHASLSVRDNEVWRCLGRVVALVQYEPRVAAICPAAERLAALRCCRMRFRAEAG